jgi:signal transduction histidine kinase
VNRRDLLICGLLAAATIAEVALRSLPGERELAIGALIAIAPLAWRSRSPWIPYAGIEASFAFMLAVGREPELTPHIVALWVTAFTFGAQASTRTAVVGLLAIGIPLAVPVAIEDPAEVIWVAGVFLVPPWVIGRLMAGRRERLEQLHALRAELEAERGRVAALAADAERARLAADIEVVLAQSLARVAELAAAARGADADARTAAFAEIRASGAEALAELRRLLGVLRGERPTATARPS